MDAKAGGCRRKWTIIEEEALLDVLEDFVTKGLRCETGSFRSGTLLQMEKSLESICPNSNLKAYPHIESKLKKWKANYSTIYDMTNTSGFAWNDAKKCIEVDSDEAWEMYVQHNKSAKGWRNKCYPIFERLGNIFGKDRANGKGTEAPADMASADMGADAHSNSEAISEKCFHEIEEVSVNHDGSKSGGSRKRKRIDGSDKIILVLEKLIETSGKRLEMITEAIVKGNEDRSDIAKELEKMGLSINDQIGAIQIILDKPQRISVFKSLNDEARMVFVQSLLQG